MAEQELASALRAVLEPVMGSPVGIENLRSLSGGASRGSWSFDAVAGEGASRPLILQCERLGEETRGAGMALQGGVLRAAARADVPVPAVVVSDRDLGAEHAVLGRFMIVERIEGQAIPRKTLRDGAFAAPARR